MNLEHVMNRCISSVVACVIAEVSRLIADLR